MTQEILDFLFREFGPFALGVLIMVWFLRDTQKALTLERQALQKERDSHEKTRDEMNALQESRLDELRTVTKLVEQFKEVMKLQSTRS